MGRRTQREQARSAKINAAYAQQHGLRLTNEWFTRETMPTWDEHLKPLGPFQKYLEIGVCEGASMVYAFEHLGVQLAVGIDPYVAPRAKQQAAFDVYRANAEHNLRGRQSVLSYEPSVKALAALVAGADLGEGSDDLVDLIYVDGDHAAHRTLYDCCLAWELLAIGGVMVMDDYNRRWQRGKPWSHEGIDAWLHGYETRYREVYRTPKQVAVRKRA